jgi:phospholipid/cholesterol/gamma-HCH transport system permease protein
LKGEPLLSSATEGDQAKLCAAGAWTASNAQSIDSLIESIGPTFEASTAITVDLSRVAALDTFGAWLLGRLVGEAEKRDRKIHLTGLADRFVGLWEAVRRAQQNRDTIAKADSGLKSRLTQLSQGAETFGKDLVGLVTMLGAVAHALVRALMNPRSFRLTSTVHHIDRVGWQAVPIILLITFLIGGIIAQQGFFHFRKFGAEDYVVDMVGILVLREIGVLIVAIMVAGRSGSSYTAELGSMKMREEIDALRTMGFDPVEILILPRVLALILALPILAFLGCMSALYGGGLVAWVYGDMSPDIFVTRLKEAISVTHFKVGMIKAPFMALVIGVVAAMEGLRVKGSAESLGQQTTASVVKSIFIVIVLDGLFAMFFASIGM